MTVTVTCEICGAVIEGGYDSETGYTQQYCNRHSDGIREIRSHYNSLWRDLEADYYAAEQNLEQERDEKIAAYIASERDNLSAAPEGDGGGE